MVALTIGTWNVYTLIDNKKSSRPQRQSFVRKLSRRCYGGDDGGDHGPAEADITGLDQDTFSKMTTYLMGELTVSSEDYKLLENMNKLTSLKYLEMKDTAVSISRNLKDLSQHSAALQPSLDELAVIEEQIAALERADAYSKKPEAKYNKLERR
ncbi:biogenesis of lysosome-related organelles complex 1 subunit 2-like [Petaurus breviceps papuanus]|uniref:biogenesis of lysosome-related organelles complex 1 subunit 2-like n=1 Tax=Petaurus breviceps papuanus TaxID=3040969 RepID=UPI0036D96C46